ncbi:MAG: Protein-tyrosine-phosphatase [Eubacterium sp.]|jgi:protein-tyrosine phosphatase|nr:Protein-tyrosine-phosphatase [Eubacterium sp.]
MIDIHSHIIHGVDDGPSNITESLRMIKEAERLGIGTVVASPHYQESVFSLDRVDENFQELLYKAQDYDVTINLWYEVFANPNSPALMRNRKKLSLNRTGTILFEFPFNAQPQKCVELVWKFRMQKITPIIAHVERNRAFINKIEYFVAFIKAGCLIQVDAASIVGVYGPKIKEFSKKLVQMKFVDMVASNAHSAMDYANWYSEAYKNVSNWVGKEDAGLLFHTNAKNILEGINNDDPVHRNILRWERMV